MAALGKGDPTTYAASLAFIDIACDEFQRETHCEHGKLASSCGPADAPHSPCPTTLPLAPSWCTPPTAIFMGKRRAHPSLQNDEFLRLVINGVVMDLTSRNEAFECLALSFLGSGERTVGPVCRASGNGNGRGRHAALEICTARLGQRQRRACAAGARLALSVLGSGESTRQAQPGLGHWQRGACAARGGGTSGSTGVGTAAAG